MVLSEDLIYFVCFMHFALSCCYQRFVNYILLGISEACFQLNIYRNCMLLQTLTSCNGRCYVVSDP